MERVATSSTRGGRWLRPQVLALLLVAGLAWLWTVDQARDMGVMPGTMGMDFIAFAVMWGLMMTAMMLPSAAPFASMYSRTVVSNRTPRLLLFAIGYLLVWGATGVPAFGIAWAAGEAAAAAPAIGTVAAAGIFAACGVYQLTPLKSRCLQHCRSPIGQIFEVASYRGALRDLRAGAHNGWFCLACCWSLMALMAAFGVMNLWAMVGLAAVVAVEKHWSRGEQFGRGVAVAAFALAIAVIWEPGLAPGLAGGG